MQRRTSSRERGERLAAARGQCDRRDADGSVSATRQAPSLSRRCAFFVYFLGIPAGTLAIAAGSAALVEAPARLTAAVAFLSAAFATAITLVAPVEARDHNLRGANECADFRR